MAVSNPHGYKRAKATGVSNHRATSPSAPRRGTHAQRRDPISTYSHAIPPRTLHTSTHTRRNSRLFTKRLAAGARELHAKLRRGHDSRRRAWPGFETMRRAKLAARTARGRAAAHRHTQRPDQNTPATRRPEIWRGIATPEIWRAAAHGAARPDTTRGARNTSGTTQEVKPQKRNEKCPCEQRHSQLHSNTPKSHMGNMRAS